MNSSRRSWYGILIAVISFLLVGGALLTALAQSEFSLERPDNSLPTPTNFEFQIKTHTQGPATQPPTQTEEPQPATDSPTSTQAPAENTPSSQNSTNTPYTFTPTYTQESDSAPACGAPAGWLQYTVKTGDTLFSISQKYQTTVFKIQLANCMGTSTRIITGTKLWVPNNPTITPTASKVPTSTKKPNPTNTSVPSVTCYPLTVSHTGTGSDPSPSPANSTGCNTGQYVAGASISLAASPASGWQVASWTGTINNASTSTSNTVTMPASNHSASVTYALIPPTCYSLTLSHTGSGSDPSPSPASSTGCAPGQYVAGATISLTASPASGWQVASWTGADSNNTSTSNSVTMPASNHSASVTYDVIPPVCFALTLSIDGSGTGDGLPLTADIPYSTGCAAGEYVAGESITITASPDGVSSVGGWIVGGITDADSSLNKNINMPVGNLSVSVIYNSP